MLEAQQSINLPNILTSLRLLFSPVLAVLLVYDGFMSSCMALIIVLFSEFTDLADGYLARKRGQVTDLGKILDPMADSIYRDTIFLSLAVCQHVSIFLVLPILYRDSIIATLRTVCAYNGIVVAARWSGKIKAVVQAVVILSILVLRILAYLYESVNANLYLWANGLLAIACAVTLYSLFDYVRNLVPIIWEKSVNQVKSDS